MGYHGAVAVESWKPKATYAEHVAFVIDLTQTH